MQNVFCATKQPGTFVRSRGFVLMREPDFRFRRIVRAWEWRQPNPWPAQRRLGFRTAPARRLRIRPRPGRRALARLRCGPLGPDPRRVRPDPASMRERHRTSGWLKAATATRHQQAAFFRGLCLDDLVLARACAHGNERAWEHFVAVYRQPLTRAAIAITGSETLGRDLADQLYAELYGLNDARGPAALPAAFLPRPRLADGLAAHHAGAAPRGSSSPHAPRRAYRRI